MRAFEHRLEQKLLLQIVQELLGYTDASERRKPLRLRLFVFPPAPLQLHI